MAQVVYQGCILSKNSTALELWDAVQKASKDKAPLQKALDDHMWALGRKDIPMPEGLANYKIGNDPVK
jgi:hypothetical protein